MRATKIRKRYLFRIPYLVSTQLVFRTIVTILERDPYFSTLDNCQSSTIIVSFARARRCNVNRRDKSRRNPSSLYLVERYGTRDLGGEKRRKRKLESSWWIRKFSPRGRIPDRIVTLAWPRTRFDIETDGWARKEERYRGLEEWDENYKEIFYSRLSI